MSTPKKVQYFQRSAATIRRPKRSSNQQNFKASVKQRKDAINQLKACVNCLKLGHSLKECPSTQSCRSCNKCHHTHLNDESIQSANSTHCSTAGSAERPSLLQILPVTLSRDGKSVNTYVFLDNGSVVSMMLTKTASALGIVLDEKTQHTELHKGTHGTKSVTFTNVNLSITGMISNQTFDIEDVQVSADIEFPQYNLEWIRKVCHEFDHLKHITYSDVDINQISILIGCDNFDLIAPREIHYGPPYTARAIQTELGWTASRKTDLPSAVTQIVKSESRECCKMNNTLYNEVLNWYKVENMPSNKDITKSETDKGASDIMESTLEFKEGRYLVGFLWKNKPGLPNNFLLPSNNSMPY